MRVIFLLEWRCSLIADSLNSNNPQSLASIFKEGLEVAQFRAREGLSEEKPKAKQILIDNNSFLESLQIKPPSPQSPKLARISGYTRHSIIDKKKLTYSNELFSPFVSKTIPEGYKAFFLRDEKTLKTFYEKLQETLGRTKFIKGEEPPTLPSFKLYSESNPVLLLKAAKEEEWHYFFRIFHEFPR